MRFYLRTLIASAAIILLLTATINLVVDPFALYGTPRVPGFNALKPGLAGHARLWKTVTVSKHAWEAIILGTSRAEVGFDPGHAFFQGRRAFNAALPGQPYQESLDFVRAAVKGGALRQVLLTVDFPMSNANAPFPGDYTQANYARSRAATLALSGDALFESSRTVARQDEAYIRQHVGLWLPNGRFSSPLPSDHRAHALDSDRQYLTQSYFPARSPFHEFAVPGKAPLESIRALVRLAHAHGVELTIAIAPAHARQWETLVAAGRWEMWEEWKRRLVGINEEEARLAQRPGFPLWDFSGYSEITTERFPPLGHTTERMRWYWDSSHFVKAAGDVALHRMMGLARPADFGVKITSTNVEAHLAATREARLKWVATNPTDVAEIHAIGEESKREREARKAWVRKSWP